MENRIAVISIIIYDKQRVSLINEYLHEASLYVLGRMGIPSKDNMNIITVVLNAPQDVINTLSGKIGKIDGVSSKVLYSKTE